MISALDTNLLLDILLPDPSHVEPSKRLLDHARMRSALVISEVVYAELSAHFPSKGDLDRFLREVSITLTPSTPEALYEAAQAWRRYLRRRPRDFSARSAALPKSSVAAVAAGAFHRGSTS